MDGIQATAAWIICKLTEILWGISRDYGHAAAPLELDEIADSLTAALCRLQEAPGWSSPSLRAPIGRAPTRMHESMISEIKQEAVRLLDSSCTDADAIAATSNPGLALAYQRVNEVCFRDCLQPDPDANPEFRVVGRHLSVLKKYWGILFRIAQETGNSPLVFLPHPLTPLVLNLQKRLELCLARIGVPELDAGFAEVRESLEYLLSSEDFDIAWECGGNEVWSKFGVAVERAISATSSHAFKLTSPECLFLAQAECSVNEFGSDLRRQWESFLCNVDSGVARAAPEVDDSTRKGEVWSSVRQVETKLRDLVAIAYRRKYGPNWLAALAQDIGEEDLRSANERMEKEGAGPDDLLHYLNPATVRCLAVRDWNTAGPLFGGARKKDVNLWLDTWLQARNRAAHHRPSHLWPDIEQSRARVACHDLLDWMGRAEPVDGAGDANTPQ